MRANEVDAEIGETSYAREAVDEDLCAVLAWTG